jgi:hypothetical protein
MAAGFTLDIPETKGKSLEEIEGGEIYYKRWIGSDVEGEIGGERANTRSAEPRVKYERSSEEFKDEKLEMDSSILVRMVFVHMANQQARLGVIEERSYALFPS